MNCNPDELFNVCVWGAGGGGVHSSNAKQRRASRVQGHTGDDDEHYSFTFLDLEIGRRWN